MIENQKDEVLFLVVKHKNAYSSHSGHNNSKQELKLKQPTKQQTHKIERKTEKMKKRKKFSLKVVEMEQRAAQSNSLDDDGFKTASRKLRTTRNNQFKIYYSFIWLLRKYISEKFHIFCHFSFTSLLSNLFFLLFNVPKMLIYFFLSLSSFV